MPRSSCGIGLIGVGRHGSRYLQHLLHDVEGAHIAAICRKQVGISVDSLPASDIRMYGDYRALIVDPAVNAVVVVTHPTLCREICLEVVKAGKPIMVEKPLAATAHDAALMVRAAEEAKVMLMTAQTLRFDPTILQVKEWLPRIGPLRSAKMVSHIEFRSTTPATVEAMGGRGALLEVGVHLLDLVRFLAGEEVVEVHCRMEPAPPAGPEIKACVEMRTEKGILCELDIARVPSGRIARLEFVGKDGRIAADWVQGVVTHTPGSNVQEKFSCQARPTVLAALQAFVQAIVTSTAPPITGRDGLAAVTIAEACYRSAARQGAAQLIGLQR